MNKKEADARAASGAQILELRELVLREMLANAERALAAEQATQ